MAVFQHHPKQERTKEEKVLSAEAVNASWTGGCNRPEVIGATEQALSSHENHLTLRDIHGFVLYIGLRFVFRWLREREIFHDDPESRLKTEKHMQTRVKCVKIDRSQKQINDLKKIGETTGYRQGAQGEQGEVRSSRGQ